MKGPNFFIVGAPKCGTTALNDFLARHPDVYMAQKEVHYFGSDLEMMHVPSREEYFRYFEGVTSEKIIGESSVWYLYSKKAAREIHSFCPEARIVIMLRNPVDVLYSLHSQHLYNYNEDERDFEKAISLDAARMAGRHLAKSVDFRKLPPYIESVRFSSQVARYFEVFGNRQVHIVWFEDFRQDPAKEVAAVFDFLGLKSWEKIDFRVVNPNKKMRSWYLHRILKTPPSWLKAFIRKTIPSKNTRHRIMALLFKFNIYIKKRKSMPEQVRMRLVDSLREDIKELEKITGRDLTSWTN